MSKVRVLADVEVNPATALIEFHQAELILRLLEYHLDIDRATRQAGRHPADILHDLKAMDAELGEVIDMLAGFSQVAIEYFAERVRVGAKGGAELTKDHPGTDVLQ